MSVFIGTYSATIRGSTYTLDITSQDDTKKILEGNLSSNNNGVPVTMPIYGIYIPWDGLHNRWLFSVHGSYNVRNDRSGEDPAILYGIQNILGYAQTTGKNDPIQTLHCLHSFAIDISGLGEDAIGWEVALTRQS